jgi:hypothetical protein
MLIKDTALKLSCKSVKISKDKMKSILSILTAVILLISSFTFNSCKDCGKNNHFTDTDKDKTIADGNESVPFIDDIALAEVEKHLRAHGASDEEIKATKHIATEHFGDNIGRIMWDNGHYWYGDDMGNHDGQPVDDGINCGLYALKRLLFVLGRHNIVDKNLWYQYTDMELRKFVFGKWEPNLERFYNEAMAPEYLVELVQIFVGDTGDYRWIYDRHNEVLRHFLIRSDVVTAGMEAVQLAEIEEKVQPLEEVARKAIRDAQAAQAKSEQAVRDKNREGAVTAAAEANKADAALLAADAALTDLYLEKKWSDKPSRRIQDARQVMRNALKAVQVAIELTNQAEIDIVKLVAAGG